MNKKQIKEALVRWTVPAFILLLAVLALLVHLSVSSKHEAQKEVDETLIELVEEYAGKIEGEITNMTEVGMVMASFLADHICDSEIAALDVAKILKSHSNAYLVVFANDAGVGITQDAAAVDFSREPYFVGKGSTKQRYVYVEQECITKSPAIVSIIPIIKDGETQAVMYMFYSMKKVKEYFYDFSLYGQSIMTFSLGDGTIVTSGGTDMAFLGNSNNIYTILETNEKASAINEVKRRMNVMEAGTVAVSNNDRNKYVSYVPLGINDWYISIAINQDYVNKQVSIEWRNVRNIVVAFLLMMGIFIIGGISVAIMMRIRYSQRSRSLETKADTDLLTDLYNKMATERKIKEYIDENPNGNAVLFVLDIDNFKKINDTRGHAFGDEVLKAIGIRLQTAFRSSDIVGRTGGDEFMVFLKDISSEAVIRKEIGKLEDVFRNFETGEYVKYSVTSSIGCALYSKDGKSFEELYKAADSALYMAKKRGKNQVARYEKES